MSEIKEYREFFIRNEKITNGLKQDQEINYPVTYQVGQRLVGNRFLKGHYPSEGVMKKFVHSIPFKLNKEDRATNLQQGLSKIPSNAQVYTEQDSIDGFTYFVLPSQLPKVVSKIQAYDLQELENKPVVTLNQENPIGNFISANKLPIEESNVIKYGLFLNQDFYEWYSKNVNKIKEYVDGLSFVLGEVSVAGDGPGESSGVEVVDSGEGDVNGPKKLKINVRIPAEMLVNTETINAAVTAAMNAYNPLDHLPIGTIIECNNPEHFNFITGKGKINTPYSKWAIADGRNGTRDKRDRVSKGVVSTTLGAESTLGTQGGANNVTLAKNNLPPHKHSYLFAGYKKVTGDSSDFTYLLSKAIANNMVLHTNELNTTNISFIGSDTETNVQEHTIYGTGNDGTTNFATEDRFGSSIIPVDIQNKYDVSLFVQKIL